MLHSIFEMQKSEDTNLLSFKGSAFVFVFYSHVNYLSNNHTVKILYSNLKKN